ncbi:MAG: EthD domain-containing protein, partial [Myxococcota bacterium]
MIKLLSFKTRHPDLTPEAFREHYEESHVPLGLSFIDRFRWRRYVRNYVVGPALGRVDFDCVTEFWVSGRQDQERIAEFVGSPEFRILDEDDRRFLDVTRRLSFEVEEHLLSEAQLDTASRDVHRLAMFITKPGAMSAAEFVAGVAEEARGFATRHCDAFEKISLDLRAPDSGEGAGIGAMLSLWTPGRDGLEDLVWRGVGSSVS